MQMRKILIFVFMAISIVQSLIIYKQHRIINKMQQNVPFLVSGETLPSFQLNSSNGDYIDNITLKKSPHSLVFIFQRPCSKCDKNLPYWHKFKKLIGDKLPVYAIVLDKHENMVKFADEANLNFEVFSPVELNEFIKKFRINMNLAQTILTTNDKVERIWLGTLGYNDFRSLLERLKKL